MTESAVLRRQAADLARESARLMRRLEARQLGAAQAVASSP
jgi:hypothetical protein